MWKGALWQAYGAADTDCARRGDRIGRDFLHRMSPEVAPSCRRSTYRLSQTAAMAGGFQALDFVPRPRVPIELRADIGLTASRRRLVFSTRDQRVPCPPPVTSARGYAWNLQERCGPSAEVDYQSAVHAPFISPLHETSRIDFHCVDNALPIHPFDDAHVEMTVADREGRSAALVSWSPQTACLTW
jgi:hypothetical protein